MKASRNFGTSSSNNTTGTSSAGDIFRALLDSGVGQPRTFVPGEIVSGMYVGNGFVSIGGKGDAILHPMDRKNGEPKVGDTFPVIVTTNGEDEESHFDFKNEAQVVVSAALAKDWAELQGHQETPATALTVTVIRPQLRKGGGVSGLKVRYGNLTGFVPRSQLRGFRQADLQPGCELKAHVEVADPKERKLVFDLTRAAEAAREQRELETQAQIEQTEVGSIVEGNVVKWLDCGALVQIDNGPCGLLHHSEIIPVRGGNSKLAPGTRVTVLVVSKDVARGRIGLSQKQCARQGFAKTAAVGDVLTGPVVAVQPFGVFVELAPGVCGMLHRSKFNTESAAAKVGDTLSVRIGRIDDAGQRIDLTM
jgi:small subunit ribosomal protein S1